MAITQDKFREWLGGDLEFVISRLQVQPFGCTASKTEIQDETVNFNF